MRKWLMLLVLLAACGSGANAGTDGGAPVCTSLCVRVPTITVHFVQDTSGSPVAIPMAQTTFSSSDQRHHITMVCDPDPNVASCDTVTFDAAGPQTIQINVPGYLPASFESDVQLGGSGCCGAVAVNPLDTTLRLQKS